MKNKDMSFSVMKVEGEVFYSRLQKVPVTEASFLAVCFGQRLFENITRVGTKITTQFTLVIKMMETLLNIHAPR